MRTCVLCLFLFTALSVRTFAGSSQETIAEEQLLTSLEHRLMKLFLSFAHIALAVEVQGDAEPKHAEGARFMTITQAPSSD